MKALILAAGYATRLYPLTKDRPKSLLLVGKKTISDYLIQKLDEMDEIDEICIVTNQKFHGIFRDWVKALRSKKRVKLLNDGTTTNENRLGAIGDIRMALETEKIHDDLVIVAGDNMFDWDFKGFIEFVKLEPDLFVVGAYELKDKKEASRYGVIELHEKGHVSNFLEKPQHPPTSLVATGIYYFPKGRLNLVSEYLKSDSKDAPGHFIEWLLKEHLVRCYVFKGTWYDIGDIESYRKANLAFADKK